VSGTLAAVAGLISAGRAVATSIPPAPYNLAMGGVALFAGWLAGQPLKVPAWMTSTPLLPLTIAPTIGTLAVSLGAYAATLPDGWPQRILSLAAVAGMILGGKVAPNVAPKS